MSTGKHAENRIEIVIMYEIVPVCVFDCVCIWQNLSIKDTLRLGYDVLHNGTSLLRTTWDGVTMVPHR